MAIVGLVLVFLAFRWNGFTAAFERDEGEYAYSAWLMRQGIMPYDHAFLQKPPMIIYTYIVGQWFSDESVVPPRVFATLVLGLSIMLLGMAVAREKGVRAGIISAWFATVMLTAPFLQPFAANTELFMLLPLMGVVLLYAVGRGNAGGWSWFLAGVLAALAILYKPISLPVLLWIAVVWVFETWKADSRPRIVIERFALACLGTVLAVGVVLLPFLRHDAGRSLRECIVAYNYAYAQSEWPGASMLSFLAGEFFRYWWVHILLLAWYIIKRPTRWWFFLGLFVTAFLGVYKSMSGHYYFLLIPFWAAISALAIQVIFDKLGRWFPQSAGTRRLILVGIVLLLTAVPSYEEITLSPHDLVRLLYGGNPFNEAQALSVHLRQESRPSDKVFIAGSEPEIFYYAKRQSSTRFDIIYPLTINTPFAEQYQNETIHSLESDPPEFIVYTRAPTSWLISRQTPPLLMPYLNRIVLAQYHPVGGILYPTATWLDSLSVLKAPQAVFGLFRRNAAVHRQP